jgi:predicted AlkP superfamily phosphohydrolase/phosphomutase
LEQSQFVYRERRQALSYLLEEFKEMPKGLLFFYLNSLDQGCHMLWRYQDPEHPAYEKNENLQGAIRKLYTQMDDALGEVRSKLDDNTTLLVMSDHGFAPFHRAVNLNTWLLENDFLALRDPSWRSAFNYNLENVDWPKTQAYAVGINSLYLNLLGREAGGIVKANQYQTTLDEIEKHLLALRDPQNGLAPISSVTRPRSDFTGDYKDQGPDLIIGYERGYRASWETPLGMEIPRDIIVDNLEAWSGDHCIDPDKVPGVLLTDRKFKPGMTNPEMRDLTVTILKHFGVDPLEEMKGQSCL